MAVALKFFGRQDDDVSGHSQSPQRTVHGKRQVAPTASNGANDEKVYITAVLRCTSGLRAKKDNPVGVESIHQTVSYGVDGILSDHGPFFVLASIEAVNTPPFSESTSQPARIIRLRFRF